MPPKRYPSTPQEHADAVATAKAKFIAACSIKIDEDIHPDAPCHFARRQAISVAVSEFWQAKQYQQQMFEALRRHFQEKNA